MDAKRGALVASILGSAVVAVDATVVNVALPAITDDLGGGLAGQQWIANAYLLTLSALILVSGSLSDLYGERRIFTLGVAGFGVASLLCALAPTVELLVVARALQGVSGALLTPASLAIIVAVFPENERGAAIGSWTAWGGIGYLAGPIIGGQIVDTTSWRWVFALNVPLVLLTLAMARSYVPAARDLGGERPRLDITGALLCALGLAGISFGLIEQPLHGWSDPLVLGTLVGGLALFAAFIVYELRTPAPMLPLDLFARRNFTVANVETFLMYGGMAVQAFFLTLFLQQVAGFSALEAGLRRARPDADDVPALAALRRGRRPVRAALVHDRRAAARRVGLPAHAAARRDDLLRRRPAARAGRLLARSRRHRVAADRDRARRRRRARRRASRPRSTTRSRAPPACSRRRRSAPCWPRPTAPRWTTRSPGRRSARPRSRGSTPRATAR